MEQLQTTPRTVARTAISPARVVSFIAAAIACSFTTLDSDLWGNVRFGLDILAERKLLPIEHYSFTADRLWVNHEWFSEVVVAGAFRAAGVPGLLLIRGAMVLAIALLMAWATRRLPRRFAHAFLAFGCLAIVPGVSTIRPQLFTQLCLAALAFVLTEAPRFRPALIVLIFAVWTNAHGGWIVGIGVIGLWALGSWYDTRRLSVAVECALVTALAVGATLLTPYGIEMWRYLTSALATPSDATDWRPIWRQPSPAFAVIWAGTVVAAVSAGSRRPRAALLLPIALLGVMSLRVARLVPLFGELVVCFSGALWPRESSDVDPPVPVGVRLMEIAAVLVVVAAMIPRQDGRVCLAFRGHPWVPDEEVASALEAREASGRLVLPFSWGHYAIWHLGPRLKVSTDGRRETLYSERVLAEQDAVVLGEPLGRSFVEREKPEYVWLPLPESDGMRLWLSTHGYRIDLTAGNSFLATREDLPVVLAAVGARSGCFP